MWAAKALVSARVVKLFEDIFVPTLKRGDIVIIDNVAGPDVLARRLRRGGPAQSREAGSGSGERRDVPE
jgi:hypothetical protein